MNCSSVGANKTPDLRKYVNLGIGYEFEKGDFCSLEGSAQGINCGNNGEFDYGGDSSKKCICAGSCAAGQCVYKTCKRFRYAGDPSICCNLDEGEDSYYDDGNGNIKTCDPKYRFNNRDSGSCNSYNTVPINVSSSQTLIDTTPEYDKTNIEYCKINENFFNDDGWCDDWISRSMRESVEDKYDADSVITEVCSRPENIYKLKCGCVLAEKEKSNFTLFEKMPVQCMSSRCARPGTIKLSTQMTPCDKTKYGNCRIGYDDMNAITNNQISDNLRNSCGNALISIGIGETNASQLIDPLYWMPQPIPKYQILFYFAMIIITVYVWVLLMFTIFG